MSGWWTRAALSVLFLFLSQAVWAQPAYLVKDLHPGRNARAGVEPVFLAGLDDLVFFWGTDPAHGTELWRSDGTPEGTFMLRDIAPGPATSDANGSDENEIVALDGFVLFTAGEDLFSEELWRSDGTPEGTALVKDIAPGIVGSSPRFLIRAGDLVFFSASDNSITYRLWRSDGTPEGTFEIDVTPHTAGGQVAAGDTLFFIAYENGDIFRPRLWKTDGSQSGTIKVSSETAASGWSQIVRMTGVGSSLFFLVWTGSQHELWKSDGTTAGTVRVTVLPSGLYPDGETAAAGDRLFFRAVDAGPGSELWRSDGTAAGTFRVKDVNPGPDGSYPEELTPVGNLLFFRAGQNATGSELWKSDGTEAGTVLVADLEPGAVGSGPANLTVWEGSIFFWASTSASGRQLWKTDGAAAGTSPVTDFPSDEWGLTSLLAAAGGFLYFGGYDSAAGNELWRTDGTAAGTSRVFDLVVGEGTLLSELTDFNGALFFRAEDETGDISLRPCDLWRSDGTAAGTVQVLEAASGESPCPYELTKAGGTLFFRGRLQDPDLWKTDGTSAVKLIDVVNVFSPFSNIGGLEAVGSRLFFIGCGSAYGCELWTTDGTSAPALVADLAPGPASSSFSVLVAAGSLVFFVTRDAESNYELWRSDGTAAGTFRIKETTGSDTWIGGGYAMGGLLFFIFHEGTRSEVWRTDGTLAGTFPVLSPGDISYPGPAVVGATLYFIHNASLWKSDGTAAGTVLVKSFDWTARLGGLARVGGLLFFEAADEEAGRELWLSDGTAAGTRRVKDIHPGIAGSLPTGIAEAFGRAVFAASNGSQGQEVWTSDGTEAGTFQLQDIAPGRFSSSPHNLSAAGGRLFFAANDGQTGTELWAFTPAAPPPPDNGNVSVTGAGWINNARGKGHFQVQAKPRKGALDGKASFRRTGLDLRSRTLHRLAAHGATAWIEGEGTVNGGGSYLFRIAVTDGQAPGGGGTDRFRVRIWDPATGATVFDSEPGTPDSSPPATPLGGGSIKIQASR